MVLQVLLFLSFFVAQMWRNCSYGKGFGMFRLGGMLHFYSWVVTLYVPYYRAKTKLFVVTKRNIAKCFLIAFGGGLIS